MKNKFAFIPSLDELLRDLDIRGMRRDLAKKALKRIIDQVKNKYSETPFYSKTEASKYIQKSFDSFARGMSISSYRHVINATGIILHTNLGRAPYCDIIDEMVPLLKGYLSLETDIESNIRTNRLSGLKDKMALVSDFEDFLFVNNNAAAFMLICSTLSTDREIIVSRGELVEIGGSFRIPDIIRCAGARLREAGTTNITRISDYEQVIGDTGLIAKIHKSNYEIKGHTAEVNTADLIKLCRRHGLVLYEDKGSWDFDRTGEIPCHENYLVSFSMDKMAGAVQSGLILGPGRVIQCMRNNPLYRTMRLSKFSILYLDKYLSRYIFQQDFLRSEVFPKIKSGRILEKRIKRIFDSLPHEEAGIILIPSIAEYGGGSGRHSFFDSFSLAAEKNSSRLNCILRESLDPPVIGRMHKEKLMIDIASVLPREDEILTSQLNKALRILRDELSSS